MGSCYSGDRVVGDHIHTDIIKCNIGERVQIYRLGTVSNRLLGGLNMFCWALTSPFAENWWGGLNMFYWAQTSPSADKW